MTNKTLINKLFKIRSAVANLKNIFYDDRNPMRADVFFAEHTEVVCDIDVLIEKLDKE